jgi:hypothetical protein
MVGGIGGTPMALSRPFLVPLAVLLLFAAALGSAGPTAHGSCPASYVAPPEVGTYAAPPCEAGRRP